MEFLRDPRPGWQADALCLEYPEVEFFPERGGSLEPACAACGTCLVRDACLEFALEHDEAHGVWGGLSGRERRACRRLSRPLSAWDSAPVKAS